MCSDDAFKPQRKVTIDTSDEAKEFIEEACVSVHMTAPSAMIASSATLNCLLANEQFVKGNDIALFMKGIPEQPQCGFSQQVVRVLHAAGLLPRKLNDPCSVC